MCPLFTSALLYLDMRYVAAYLLATLGEKSNPSKEDVQKILESVGLDVDDEKLSKVAEECCAITSVHGSWCRLRVMSFLSSLSTPCSPGAQ